VPLGTDGCLVTLKNFYSVVSFLFLLAFVVSDCCVQMYA